MSCMAGKVVPVKFRLCALWSGKVALGLAVVERRVTVMLGTSGNGAVGQGWKG